MSTACNVGVFLFLGTLAVISKNPWDATVASLAALIEMFYSAREVAAWLRLRKAYRRQLP